MSDQMTLSQLVADAAIVRATVVTVHADGTVRIDHEGGTTCHVLETGVESLRLAAGDTVLAWLSSTENEPGVVLGRVGPTSAPLPAQPDQILLEARKSLTLRVGDGSITIREDGKILIKGKDLVSHAKRLNRIKGGSVQIN